MFNFPLQVSLSLWEKEKEGEAKEMMILIFKKGIPLICNLPGWHDDPLPTKCCKSVNFIWQHELKKYKKYTLYKISMFIYIYIYI